MTPLERFDYVIFKWLGILLNIIGCNVIDPNFQFDYRSMFTHLLLLFMDICIICTICSYSALLVRVINGMTLSANIQVSSICCGFILSKKKLIFSY